MSRNSTTTDGLGFDIVAPHAASLVESLRAFGYELPTAIADLVDNSIFAQARNVWVEFLWDGEASAICVTDDGCGMSETQLRDAMRPGSSNPLDDRDPRDLGRFGLGLKTASFSQCRRATVRSKTTAGGEVTRCWDLDTIARTNDWRLLHSADEAAESRFKHLHSISHGTAVLWQSMDRLVKDQRTDHKRDHDLFLRRIEETQLHLGMVFHRLLTGKRPLKIFVNERCTEPWDPFLETQIAIDPRPTEKLRHTHGQVIVRPFVLPHLSKIAPEIHARAAGPRGWNAHQGFYIYRNYRLLVAGDWLGFGWTKEEHYKLARIVVDLPNTMDHDWEIDVTKSRACPPPTLRADLRRIGEDTRARAKRIYSFRGAKLMPKDGEERIFLWHQKARHGRVSYEINRDHPLVRQSLAASSDKAPLRALLRMVEETIPVPLITITDREKPDQTLGPFEAAKTPEIVEVMREAFNALRATGYSAKEALTRLRTMEPFPRFPAELQSFVEKEKESK